MGKTVPIRFNDEQVERLETAAALAGYKHLSTYVKDRLFNQVDAPGQSVEQWATLDRLTYQLESIERNQLSQQTIMAIAVYLLQKGGTAGILNGLRAELASLGTAEEVIGALLPEVASDIERLSGDD